MTCVIKDDGNNYPQLFFIRSVRVGSGFLYQAFFFRLVQIIYVELNINKLVGT